jgi:hypothetical protein
VPTPLQRRSLLDAAGVAGFMLVIELGSSVTDHGWASLLQGHTWPRVLFGTGIIGLLAFALSAGIRSLLVHRPVDRPPDQRL